MKKCKRCEKQKELTEFYSHPQMLDGHLNFCKECVVKKVHDFRISNLEYMRDYDKKRWKKRYKSKEFREKKLESGRAWRKKNPQKWLAQSKADRKYKDTRPTLCQLCGKSNTTIHGHHPDYSKPLEVIFVCVPCHYKFHHEEKN